MTPPICTLLLVEDFSPDREQYRRYLLGDLGCTYRFLEAESVEEGLELCCTQPIDAILLDYLLPDGDGLDFLAALHQQRNGDRPPVVIVTGEGDETVAVKAIKLGAEDYLVKRCLTPELLQVTMRSAIENAQLRLQLRQREQQFRVSIENMLDCFGIYSALRNEAGQITDFRIDYLNSAALKDTQLNSADLGKGLCELFPSHYETGLFADYCRVIETGEPLVKENLIYSDRFGIQYLVRAYDLRVSKLNDGFVISWRDVTARKQAELRMQEVNQQLTTVWESMTDAYVTLDREWRIVYANQAAVQVIYHLTQLQPEEFLGQSHWEVFPSIVGQAVERDYRRAVAEQIAVHSEVWYEPTGNWFEVHAYPSAEGLGIYFRDVTVRKQTEQTVQQQLAEIEALYTTAPIGLCFVDTSLRFVRINEQLAQTNGLPVSEHIGHTLQEILPEMAHQLEPLYRQVIASGEPILNLEVQGTNRAQPNIERQWLVCFHPQKDANQQVVGVNVVVQDITEAKRDEVIRKRTEADLANTASVLYSIINGSSDVIFVKDLQGRYVVANSTAASWLETTTEAMLGQDDTHLFPPQLAQEIQQTDRQVIQTSEAVVFEEQVPKQNLLRTLLSAKYPWRDLEGNTLGVIGISRDISDRIQTELALREQTRLLQLVVDSVGDGLILANPQGEFVMFNQAAERMFGSLTNDRSWEEWSRTYGLYLPDQQTLFRDRDLPLSRAIRGEIATDVEVFVRRDATSPGLWVSISGFPVRDTHQEITGGVITCRDITEAKRDEVVRKQAESALRQSEERYRYLAELIPQLVWIADPQGVLLDVNERWLEFTGMTLEQVQSQGWAAIVHPDDRDNLAQCWTAAQQGNTPYQAEGRLRRVDGVYQWHLHQAMPLKDDQGQTIRWFGTATNIHDLKQIQAERTQLLLVAQAARAEAEAANRSKDEFVAVVAHELRSPLNSIAGWAQLLRTRQFDPAVTAKALETIWRNTQIQVQLVEDLLDISRMVQGTLQLNLAPVSWVEVIEAALDTVRPMAEAKQIQLETQFITLAQVKGDFARLQQIVVNLLTNAIKFTPHGRVEVQLCSLGSQAQLCIRDTGKGIAPEFLPRIFDRFQQGQRNSGSKDGLGLGLAIVKNLVELHGGTIVADSPGVGQGATFTVQLPQFATGVQSALKDDPVPKAVSLAGVRILIVDDEPDMLSLITYVLQEAGAEVQPVSQIAAALTGLPQFKPDILLSDLALPEGSGYELVQQMRSLPEGQIPAIALTAYASATHEERSLQAGFQRHLAKPVEAEVLIAAIAHLVRKSNA